MGTVGVGIDLIEIGRLERALDRYPRLARRLFTEQEIASCERLARPGRHLAARFAAKEATVKALGLGRGQRLTEIEILSGPDPVIRLHPELGGSPEVRGVSLKVSLTHERELAAAVVVAER